MFLKSINKYSGYKNNFCGKPEKNTILTPNLWKIFAFYYLNKSKYIIILHIFISIYEFF